MTTPIQQQRHIPVPGTTNLRNLGGYETTDGRKVKWGVAYRGDQLADVPAEDAQSIIVKQLHIHDTFDFRSPGEVAAKTYNVEGIVRHANPVDATFFGDYIKSGKPFTVEILLDLYKKVYRAFVRDHAAVFGGVIKSIIDLKPTSDKAVMVHCTAGKDRTGIISFLLLTLLGVKRETIHEDYLLTNQHFKIPAYAKEYMSGLNLDDACLKVFWSVDAKFLETAEDEIRLLGGIEKYTAECLKLTNDDIKKLKDIMLE
ncbi:protein-tyrosine phosphatase [Angomonas deanei]|uniref:Tyrosine phosphatase family, putative n=1 Tax=Angomonas deanei TaxID=59799 RepID=S9WVK9_9TRYP|nr:protein-tyrosine phosphatase [Angomonas deanei]EPY43506.1 protein-tyrosine phosphatase [Angomonas deanei]CAD2221424.1 Tyrosine phosphatase family, putative [Angomonas deanei]|eukprot:EPY41177.1 protein-tyrosine phosphatase [Angomonas deanei]